MPVPKEQGHPFYKPLWRRVVITAVVLFWFVFELFYITLLVVVLAVVGSAAGVLLRDFFGIQTISGSLQSMPDDRRA